MSNKAKEMVFAGYAVGWMNPTYSPRYEIWLYDLDEYKQQLVLKGVYNYALSLIHGVVDVVCIIENVVNLLLRQGAAKARAPPKDEI